jgi:hypothetical protein
MIYRYVNPPKTDPQPNRGRPIDPSKWVSGPIEWKRDCHYAYHKHRAQTRYRKEPNNLTLQEWMNLWTEDLWFKRGRSSESICLIRTDDTLPWSINNVHFGPRRESLHKTAVSRWSK